MRYAVLALYVPLFLSALGAFVLSAVLMKSLGAAQAAAYASVSFLIAGAVWVRCGAIWNGRATRLWPDLAAAAAFLALLIAAGRGFGPR